MLSLEPGGPAAQAGVLIGDILVELGGVAVNETADIQSALDGRAPGQAVDALFLRGGDSRKIAITVGERPRRG